MNPRTILVTTTSLIALSGVISITFVLINSLGPSASSGATLPRIDVSEMSDGTFLRHSESYSRNYSADLLVLKDFDSNLYIYRVLRNADGFRMPDLDWDHWGGNCQSFGPEMTGADLLAEGRIKCHDEQLGPRGSEEWRWSYSGVNLGEYTGNMEQLAYVLEGKYAVVGKHNN